MRKFINKNLSKIVIIFIIGTMLITINNIKSWSKKDGVLCSDNLYYYAYLPATFIYKDLKLSFFDGYCGAGNYQGKDYIFWTGPDENGNKVIPKQMGEAFLQLPFFFAAHLYAYIFDYNTGGYSVPYKIALLICNIFWSFIGLIFLRKVLKRFFSEIVTSITMLSIVFATNLFVYNTQDVITHSFNFSIGCIYLYFVLKWFDKPNFKYTLFLGLTIGLFTLIRGTNSIFAIGFLLLYKRESIKTKFMFFVKNYKLLLLLASFIFIVWVPQFLYWKYVTGNFYTDIYIGQPLFLNNPQISNLIFSYRNDWLVYHPVMIIALFGIILSIRKLKDFSLAMFVVLFVFVYICSSFWCWWQGGSFGQRVMIDLYSLLAIPFASSVKFFIEKSSKIKVVFLIILFLFTFHSVFEMFQWRKGVIHYDSMSQKTYWMTFFKLHHPDGYWEALEPPDYEKAKKGIYKPLDE